MTITEIRDALTQLIDAGHGESKLFDNENPEFIIDGLIQKSVKDENGDTNIQFYFTMDEV